MEGQHLLPPILDFQDMKFPAPILRQLAAKNITRPTPIQMQVDALRLTPSHLHSVCSHATLWPRSELCA